jgi:hypothetical protein
LKFCARVDGLPYLLGTGGVTSMPTSSDADWSSDLTLLTGALEITSIALDERCAPIFGDLQVGGMTLHVHDLSPSSGIASGHPFVTYLDTRESTIVDRTWLTSGLDESETGTIAVDDTSAFAASGVVWIDREAIGYASKTSTSFDTLTRGKYGSLPASHVVDADTTFTATVWSTFPPGGFEGRRVTLWYVNADNVARLFYVGVVRDGPNLTEGDDHVDGAVWELPLEAAWNVEKENRLGMQLSSTRVTGFDGLRVQTLVRYPGDPWGLRSFMTQSDTDRFQSTLAEVLSIQERQLNGTFTSAGVNARASLRQEGRGVVLRVTGNVGGQLTINLTVGTTEVTGVSSESSDPRLAQAIVEDAPTTLIGIGETIAEGNTFPVSTVFGMPSSWTPDVRTDSPYTTTVRYVLAGAYGEKTLAVIEPSAHSAAPPSITAERARVVNRDTGIEDPTPGVFVESPLSLHLASRVTTTHWLHGLRYGVIGDTSVSPPINGPVSSDVDPRNYDWSRVDYALFLSGTAPSARTWILDGSQTLSQIFCDALAFNGIGLGIKNGRVSPFAFSPPRRSEPIAATITSTGLVGKSWWKRNDTCLANVIQVSAGNSTNIVNDQLSISQWGQRRPIDLAYPPNERGVSVSDDPRELASQVLHRVLGLWSRPTSVRTVHLSAEEFFNVWTGDYVTVTDWLTPDGSGGRGPQSKTGQVIGKRLEIEAEESGFSAVMSLDLLSYGRPDIGSYAPCCKVGSIGGATLSISTAFLGAGAGGTSAITDFAGSNLSTYDSTANDGGVTRFAIGDRVKLRKLDVDTVVEEAGFEIIDIDDVANTIELDASPTTVIGVGEFWVIVFDDYYDGTAITDNMGDHAWVGDYTTNVIGTSTNPADFWAP